MSDTMMENPIRNRFLQECLDSLQAGGIPFCISRNHLKFWIDGPSDVDLIVHPDAIEKIVTRLESAARSSGYRLVAKTKFDNLCLTFHAKGTGFVRLDLDTAVRWRSRTLLSANEILTKRIECNGLPIPAPEHEVLIMLSQCAWCASVIPKYRERIQFLMSEGVEGEAVKTFLASRFGLSETGVSEAFSTGANKELRTKFKNGKHQQRIHNFYSLVVRIIGRVRRPPGLVIYCISIPEEERREIARRLELLSPTAKAVGGRASFKKSMLAVLRGGTLWADETTSTRMLGIVKLWTGSSSYFEYEDSMMRHPSSSSVDNSGDASGFIADALANAIGG